MPASKSKTTAWRPIETAPKDEFLLLWNDDFYEIGFWARSNGTYKFSGWTTGMEGEGFVEIHPTHWHPLPERLSSASMQKGNSDV